ncbi:hypothetical protein [Streptomyces tropicalis]|uniref:Lipoprotein n=1 Tax=Streptomyces tropicalis TaxID=3034234 RepID=A0ABT5ZZA9_9ACTN|nr:hypothetical protein [Streptomyces tropicalis]MDF3297728.1 hypothetical protein [Streptomyces tropicalis]
MRRTTLHRTSVTAAAAAAAALLLAGCGTQHGGGGSPGSAASAPPAPASAHPSGSGRAPAGCAGHAELTAADSGRTLCVPVGGQIRLRLDGTRERPWTPVRTTGTALRAGNAGIALPPGDAVAAFDAVAPGTARLTASRPLCATGPQRISCKGLKEWTVTVRVTGS